MDPSIDGWVVAGVARSSKSRFGSYLSVPIGLWIRQVRSIVVENPGGLFNQLQEDFSTLRFLVNVPCWGGPPQLPSIGSSNKIEGGRGRLNPYSI